MRKKTCSLSNFSHSMTSISECYRPEKENELKTLVTQLEGQASPFLARGNGLSYNDCCINDAGIIIDSTRLNHLLFFDEKTGMVTCQAAATFADLFLVHPDYIPPVIPGTLHATLAGGVANDVHGKNNYQNGTLGRHIVWIELLQGNKLLRLSREENPDLFQATIGGLGLTGVILRLCLQLSKRSRFVSVDREKYETWETLLQAIQEKAPHYAYHAAWLDLLNTRPRSVLFLANHNNEGHVILQTKKPKTPVHFSVPPVPFRLINKWNMACFNRLYFKVNSAKKSYILPLQYFNNPLDSISHWNRLYGKKGFLQFQGLVKRNIFLEVLDDIIALIKTNQAVPTLAVLKYFNEAGEGLLSFVEPGACIAIDFINTPGAKKAILSMNALISRYGGKIYLAKDMCLTREQFLQQYPKHSQFDLILEDYEHPPQSNLSRRLGIGIPI